MAVSTYEHHELMEFLKKRWGEEKARTMMNLLPAVGWADVATKDDLASLRNELKGEMSAMESRLTSQSSNNLRLLFFAMLASNATFAGLVLAAVRLG